MKHKYGDVCRHDSDCALHNEPTCKNNQCDCSRNKPSKAISHVWDEGGERCLVCGDKDWFASKYCAPVDAAKSKKE